MRDDVPTPYVLPLFCAVAVGILLAVAAFAGRGDAQAVVPQTDPFVTACQIASDSAAVSGLVMERCRRVSQEIDGNDAFVVLDVKIATVGRFEVRVWLYQTTWSTTGFVANQK